CFRIKPQPPGIKKTPVYLRKRGLFAETEGFEPSDGFPSLVFKTSTFGRSVTSPATQTSKIDICDKLKSYPIVSNILNHLIRGNYMDVLKIAIIAAVMIGVPVLVVFLIVFAVHKLAKEVPRSGRRPG